MLSFHSVPSHWPHLLTIHFLSPKASPLPRKLFINWSPRQKIYCKPYLPEPRVSGIHTFFLAWEKSFWIHMDIAAMWDFRCQKCLWEATKYLALSGSQILEFQHQFPHDILLRSLFWATRWTLSMPAWHLCLRGAQQGEEPPRNHREKTQSGRNHDSAQRVTLPFIKIPLANFM